MAPNSKYVTAKIFQGNLEDFVYPESNMPEFKEKMDMGLAFSGGGTRSASLTLGQLRALKQLGILDKCKYCSSVSGGTWGLTPYIFLDDSITDDEFLGIYKDPSSLTKLDLSYDDKKSLASAISNSKLVKEIFKNLLEGSEMFSRIIGDIFLKPFLLNEDIFFTLNDSTLEAILQTNDNLTRNDFYTVSSRNRPFLIVNCTILRSIEVRIPFEMTPLYCGINKLYVNAGADQRFDIGGGFVEPHGFDSDAPDDIFAQPYKVRLNRNRLSISDMLGSSGAAPADIFRRFMPLIHLFPNFNYWSPIADKDKMREKEYDFGDGGLLENLGIMPLLRRKVGKVMVFVNGKTPIQKLDNGDYKISDSIPALFKEIPNQNGDKNFDKNIVLDNTDNQYEKLVDNLFQKQKEGLPTIHIDTYNVLKNDHHDIKGNWQVKICWVYNSRPAKWEESLTYEVKNSLVNNEYGKDFPYFNTFMENFPYIIELTLEQAQLASQLASWMIIESKNEILNFLKD
jgi:hypothetical protein